MKKIVFAGPTLTGADRAAHPDLIFMPPAAQGDIYRALAHGPSVIGLIDGYFEDQPAVCHKEILVALAAGVQVFGGGSMGAIRAAELDGFGMRGVGVVYEWYRDEVLGDDDEVAVVHGPAELEYVCLTVAMVNVRVTIRKAIDLGVTDEAVGAIVLRAAKGLFYKNRTWPRVFSEMAGQLGQASSYEGLRRWIVVHAIDQKRQDGLKVLDAIRGVGPDPLPTVNFRCNHTVDWERIRASVDAAGAER